ncbi:hypothetical protein B0H17DRAFT_1331725 [Mycena rosella]|uniref:DUF6534 domain-containing protein n=1 Tax=Mycena rosella TaxID=1033263 RepID=A0AAD7DF01_MYCRO|nr:hypothetical protein B0H17DRAFT_1331725 [Mycena rosella]
MAPPSPPNVELLLGPMLIGVLLNTTLYGVLLVQMLMYYTRYKRDRKWFRYLALYLLIAETANVVFDIGLIYEPLIVRYGTARALEVSPLLLRPDAAVTVAISTPIQLFVAWRVKVLTKSYFFPVLIAIPSLISFAGGLSVTIMVSLHPSFSSFNNFHPFVITWLSATAMSDVILSGALIYSLYNRKTGARTTDRYVNRLIRLTVQTGSITAITSLLDLLVFLFTPGTTLQFIWDFPLSKLYTIALLSTQVSLNARPWKEDARVSEDTVNVLFDHTPVERRISSVVVRHFHSTLLEVAMAEYTSVPPHPPLELHRRRPDLAHRELSDDLERGTDGQKVSPL